ncbi:---NA---, partial [Paramuricea clavata]
MLVVQFHVNIACSEDVIRTLPTRKNIDWDHPVVFGRREGADVFINDIHASRSHVELKGQILSNDQVRFMTRNASEKQGYNLNEQYITDDKWRELNKGDKIKIAGLICDVDINPAGAIMDREKFVIEFIWPQAHSYLAVPGQIYSTTNSPNDQPDFDNHNRVLNFQLYVNPPENLVAPQPVHGSYVQLSNLPPNNGMQPNWMYGGIQPGQPHQA